MHILHFKELSCTGHLLFETPGMLVGAAYICCHILSSEKIYISCSCGLEKFKNF